MIMWAGYVVIVVGLLEEVMYATLAARNLGGTQHLIVGLALIAIGVLAAVIDGIKGKKEHAQIIAESHTCPYCGLQLTEDCKVCPRCKEAVE
jgi:hypothetical protein